MCVGHAVPKRLGSCVCAQGRSHVAVHARQEPVQFSAIHLPSPSLHVDACAGHGFPSLFGARTSVQVRLDACSHSSVHGDQLPAQWIANSGSSCWTTGSFVTLGADIVLGSAEIFLPATTISIVTSSRLTQLAYLLLILASI